MKVLATILAVVALLLTASDARSDARSDAKRSRSMQVKLAKPVEIDFSRQNMLACSFSGFAAVTRDAQKPGVATYEIGDDQHSMIFGGLNTDKPVVKGNAGEASLILVTRTADQLVLIEPNVSGNIFTYTIRRDGFALWTKTYRMVGRLDYGMVRIGHCR